MKTQFVTISMLIAALATGTAVADNAQQPQQMNDPMQAQSMPAPSDPQNPPLKTSSAAPASTANDMGVPAPSSPAAPNSN